MATRNEEDAHRPEREAPRRTAARSTTAKSTAAKSSSSHGDSDGDGARESSRDRPVRRRPSEGTRTRRPELSSLRAAQRAVVQLHELTTREIEAVVGMSRKDDGNWSVVVEVVEAHHFPDTSDVMAEYSVDVDAQGELVGYSRGKRYLRGRPGDQ